MTDHTSISKIKMANKEESNKIDCCVYGCKSGYSADENMSFHQFPNFDEPKVLWKNNEGIEELVDRRRMWSIMLNVSKNAMRNKELKVCSKHFNESDFSPIGLNTTCSRLKPTAIPSQNLPKCSLSSPKKRSPPKNKTVKQHNKKNKISDNYTERCECYRKESFDENLNSNGADDLLVAKIIIQELKNMTNTETQVSSDDLLTSVISLIDTEKKLYTMTGIHSFKILDEIIELHQIFFPDIKEHKLSLKERIIMVFFKLKQGLSFAVLGILFNDLKSETCTTYNLMIPQLAYIFKALICWPSKQEIVARTQCKSDEFENVRVVLECTEMNLQMPKCLRCRMQSYSSHKSNYTLKFLLGISPIGLISYISSTWGGSALEEAMFEQSRIIENMQTPDAIMVDKGFPIDDICKKKNITVLRTPSLKNQNKLNEEETLFFKDITRAQINVKRVKRKLKTFNILRHTYPWAHLHLSASIMIIIGGLCNICPPLYR